MTVYGHIQLIEDAGMPVEGDIEGLTSTRRFEVQEPLFTEPFLDDFMSQACWLAYMQVEMFPNTYWFPEEAADYLQQRGVLTQMWRHRGASEISIGHPVPVFTGQPYRDSLGETSMCLGHVLENRNPVRTALEMAFSAQVLYGLSFQWPRDWGVMTDSTIFEEAIRAINLRLWTGGNMTFWQAETNASRKTEIVKEFGTLCLMAWCDVGFQDEDGYCPFDELQNGECPVDFQFHPVDRHSNAGFRDKNMLRVSSPRMYELIEKTWAKIARCPSLNTTLNLRRFCRPRLGTVNTSSIIARRRRYVKDTMAARKSSTVGLCRSPIDARL
jgi:hypothetical protein